ncbi:hypothetical protein DGWBC_1664 [Dehalogenimonas sp. WBC-2]|nr:hypothetical protein DGWBC_1664 [Dehalogenimonas sp. WBC-2]
MQDFKKLNVWQKAHDLAIDVYRMTSRFPSTEVYSLTSQMRRCGMLTALIQKIKTKKLIADS